MQPQDSHVQVTQLLPSLLSTTHGLYMVLLLEHLVFSALWANLYTMFSAQKGFL